MKDGKALLEAAVTEADWLRTVTDYATLRGWLWTHFRPAQTDRGWRTSLSGYPGFPDIFAVRGNRVVVVELKSMNGRLTEGQREWLDRLSLTGIETHVFRPSDWSEVERVLA